MNKKTLAVAALALIATSGLASAQTVRQQPRLDREVRFVSPLRSANAAIYQDAERQTSPYAPRAWEDPASSRFFDWRVGANTN